MMEKKNASGYQHKDLAGSSLDFQVLGQKFGKGGCPNSFCVLTVSVISILTRHGTGNGLFSQLSESLIHADSAAFGLPIYAPQHDVSA